MKHTFFLFISLLSVVFGKAQEKADFQSDEFLYAFNASGVTVVGQTKTGYKMTEVTIPETVEFESQKYIVTKIGNNAFGYNQNLVKVTMGDGVKTICESAFEACGNLKRITLSKTLEEIGDFAFLMCVSLDSVVLPQTIKKLGNNSFYHNSRLKNIYCLAMKTPEFGGLVFCTYGYLHVLKGCKQSYHDYGMWDVFFEIVDDIDPENFESETKNNKDDAETNKNDDPNKDDNPSKDDDLNKDDNPNKDSGSTSDNTETTGGSNLTDKPASDKDEEKELSTAIREISTMQSQKAFSLTGVRRDSPLKGINIINGKKILVR